METQLDMIGTVEFGDWLIHELKKEKMLSKPVSKLALEANDARVAALIAGEKLLLEFLLYQEARMMRAPG